MKASCTLVASVVAASTVALTSVSSASGDRDISFIPSTYQIYSAELSNEPTKFIGYIIFKADDCKGMNSASASLEKGKFAPKYDGLRFIETLITAHR